MKEDAKIALSKIESKWKPVIIYNLIHYGAQRYTDFKKSIPEISSRMLTLKLHELTKDGIIERKHYETFPPKVVYSLSEKGQGLNNIFIKMNKWGEQHLQGIKLGYPHEDNPNNQCLAMVPLDIIKPKWVLDIIFQLKTSSLSFKQLLADIDGINKRILSLTLRKLKTEAIISVIYSQGEKKYCLNSYGHTIFFIICELGYWNKEVC
ncbi:winged helix-turn-helix transcriptional regulator [Staphylococcus ureilyticus]|uniref:winged helix-turn-helix transcriptional regulator n=1 Tax=Staphylococcus ureilyticus TaxID=94138 RepID=UPI0021A5950B|nr:winged helix-turn-helix transcriptional regulator [Staphylococcus ureilyticus]MCT1914855.1 winged helix-turn-helix transcriptional regulator [Staphylococcus ureilyticus]